MTDPTLTSERLDELAKRIPIAPYWRGAFNALIAKARRADAAERERDEWKDKFEKVRRAESDALAENDALTLIARMNGFQRDKAERERDALRALVKRMVEVIQADDEAGYNCSACGESGKVPHYPGCVCIDAYAALAEANQ